MIVLERGGDQRKWGEGEWKHQSEVGTGCVRLWGGFSSKSAKVTPEGEKCIGGWEGVMGVPFRPLRRAFGGEARQLPEGRIHRRIVWIN